MDNMNRRKTYTLFSYIMLSTFLFSFIYFFEGMIVEGWYTFIFIIISLHILFTFTCLKFLKINIFSVSVIFIILIYIFHIGQIIVKVLSPSYVMNFDVSELVLTEVYRNSIYASLLIITFTVIGIIIGSKKNDDINVKKTLSKEKIVKIGWLISILTIPIEFYQTILKLITSQELGYLAVLDVESSGIMTQIARFHILGISLLIMGYSKTKKSGLLYMIYSAYLIFSMLTGSRIYAIVTGLIVTYVFFKANNKKMTLKIVIMSFVIVLFGSTILNTLADIRAEGIDNMGNFIENINYNFKNNPILDILEELGATVYTVAITLSKVPEIIEYSNGIQFLSSFLTVLPNIGGVFTEMNRNSNFVFSLNVQAIGGSYVAELLYTSRYLWVLIAMLFGFLLQKLSAYFDNCLGQGEFLKAAYCIAPIFSIIIWVRGSFTGLPRNMIWSFIFLYVLEKLVVNSKTMLE